MLRIPRLGALQRAGKPRVWQDTTPPTLGLSTLAESVVTRVFSVTVEASKAVTGLVAGDITIINGNISNFVAISATLYTFDVTPIDVGTVSISIAAGVCADLFGNLNLVAGPLTVTAQNPVLAQILITQPSDIVQGFGLLEAAGAVSANDAGPNNYDGTPTNVTFGAAAAPGAIGFMPSFDGATSRISIYNAGMAFPTTKGTALVYVKPPNAGWWTDGVARTALTWGVDNSNRVELAKSTANGALAGRLNFGGTTKTFSKTGMGGTTGFWMALTWDKTPGVDEGKFFVDAIQSGATQNGLGAWAGALNSTRCNIGCFVNTTPTQPLSGYVSMPFLWRVALTIEEIQAIVQSMVWSGTPNPFAIPTIEGWGYAVDGGGI